MIRGVKVFCSALYLTALASLAGLVVPVSRELAWAAPRLAVSIIGLHVLEVLVFMKYVLTSDSGDVLANVFWTILWGFGHWKPLADRADAIAESKGR